MRILTRVIIILLITFSFAYDVSAATVSCTAATDTQFVPSWQKVYISQDKSGRYIYQYMYWDSLARLKWFKSNISSTFEPDAFFYNYDGKAYGNAPTGYWASGIGHRASGIGHRASGIGSSKSLCRYSGI